MFFSKLYEVEDISYVLRHKFGRFSHSGLVFQPEDYKFIVDLSFEINNHVLWGFFIKTHDFYSLAEAKERDPIRRHMRRHALLKPSFMREWMRRNWAAATQAYQERNKPYARLDRKQLRRERRRQFEVRSENLKFIHDDAFSLESIRGFEMFSHFAFLMLMEPENVEAEFGCGNKLHELLQNCFEILSPRIPTLDRLAISSDLTVEMVLYAASIETMRVQGNLNSVEYRLLQALRVGIYRGYDSISEEENNRLKSEVDRQLFPDLGSAERFLREYIEPQLAQSGYMTADIWLLQRDEAFSHLRPTLSIEWLARFPELAILPLDSLFEIAAQYGNRYELNEIIILRCEELMSKWPILTGDEEIEQRRTFWLVRAFYFLTDIHEEYWSWLRIDKNTVFILYELSGRINRSDRQYWPMLTSNKIEAILEAFIDHWPKVVLPNHYGTGSPKEEKAYRFLSEVIWSINSDDSSHALPVLNRLLKNSRISDFHMDLQSIYATQLRRRALRDFTPPLPQEILKLLDGNEVVTVEGLRKLVLYELQQYQQDIHGGEFNSAARYYEKGERLDEVSSTEIIAERIKLRLEPQNITVTPEHQLKDRNRSDFTVTKMMGGQRRLLVTEVKGQWHRELYTAASTQLYERYSIHPDAEQQGIFLVIWFGANEDVAGRKKHRIESAEMLKSDIEKKLPTELLGLIDVFVLDVSRP